MRSMPGATDAELWRRSRAPVMGTDALPIFQAGHKGSIPFARSNPKPQVSRCLPVAAPGTGSPSPPCHTRVHCPVASSTCPVKSAATLPRSRRSACRV
jgi:hypothetical protein